MDAQFITPEQGQRFARIVSTIVDEMTTAESSASESHKQWAAAMNSYTDKQRSGFECETSRGVVEMKLGTLKAAEQRLDKVERDIDDLLSIIRGSWPEDFPHAVLFCRKRTITDQGALDLELSTLQTRFERAAIFAALPQDEPGLSNGERHQSDIPPIETVTSNNDDPFFGPYQPKVIRDCFGIESPQGWTDFANGCRASGRMRNAMGSNGKETSRLVEIRKSVFTERGVIPPT